MRTPEEKSLPVVSTASDVALLPAVNLYQTLLFVCGAPQLWFACASVASVVAALVSTVSVNGRDETSVAPPILSLDGGLAAPAVAANPPMVSGRAAAKIAYTRLILISIRPPYSVGESLHQAAQR